MTVRYGKVIVDTNLLMNALDFKKSDVFDWIDEVYEEIYINIEVLNEFRIETEKEGILAQINQRNWKLFDHKDSTCLTDNQRVLYWTYVSNVRKGFKKLQEKKEALGLIPKTSNNIGEIHSIALAQLISANIISSNDYEIREVINDENIKIYSSALDRDVFLEQDTTEDFCVYCAQARVTKPSNLIKFFKVCHISDDKEKLEMKVAFLRQRLIESVNITQQ